MKSSKMDSLDISQNQNGISSRFSSQNSSQKCSFLIATQAAAEDKSIEEVAAVRWGSLDTFKKMLAKAEGRSEQEEDDRRSHREERGRRRSPGRQFNYGVTFCISPPAPVGKVKL